MNVNTDIFITEKDFYRLRNILAVYCGESENLEIELNRAILLSDDEVPRELVTMNTTFIYKETQTGEFTKVTLVYPQDANESKGKVSVLSPLGSALIGLSAGQSINWMFPNGETKTLKIEKIIFQPEANGDWHL